MRMKRYTLRSVYRQCHQSFYIPLSIVRDARGTKSAIRSKQFNAFDKYTSRNYMIISRNPYNSNQQLKWRGIYTEDNKKTWNYICCMQDIRIRNIYNGLFELYPSWIDLTSLWESVHARLDRSQFALRKCSHSFRSISVCIRAFTFRSQIHLTP